MFKVGDIVVTNKNDLLGKPMQIICVSKELRICMCQYEIDGIVYQEDFSFDELTIIIDKED